MVEIAKIWTRQVAWRQGHILKLNTAAELNLSHDVDPVQTCVIVISHDCDLANDNLAVEPNVEVIVGRFIDKINGNYAWGKSPRTLHIEVQHATGKKAVELVTTAKHLIPKNVLVNYDPDMQYELSAQALSTLRSWLAVRYNRAAFPDLFNNRLGANKLDRALAKLIAPLENYLSGVFFIIDGGQTKDHSDGRDYELIILLVYPIGDDPEDAYERVDGLKGKVVDLFANQPGIQLKNCIPISEDDLPVSRAKLALEWRLEYLTLQNMEES